MTYPEPIAHLSEDGRLHYPYEHLGGTSPGGQESPRWSPLTRGRGLKLDISRMDKSNFMVSVVDDADEE